MKFINTQKLQILAEKYMEKYKQNAPYPHIFIDSFIENSEDVLNAFSHLCNIDFYEYNNPLEKKLGYDQIAKLPNEIADCLAEMNSPVFLAFLETLTGIEGLIPDPYFRGGGVHFTKRGGKLDIHIDFNIHPKLKLDRRISLILYLNKNWQESWHGDFQVWEGHQLNGEHILTRLHQKIYPHFNRVVIFSTSEKSYHGHPEPLNCPTEITRKSLALYYYTNGRPQDEQATQHSTLYVKRPYEDASLDELRKRRNSGRINNDTAKVIDHLKT